MLIWPTSAMEGIQNENTLKYWTSVNSSAQEAEDDEQVKEDKNWLILVRKKEATWKIRRMPLSVI